MSAAIDELDRHIEHLESQLVAARQARDLVAGLPGLGPSITGWKIRKNGGAKPSKKAGGKPGRVSKARRPTNGGAKPGPKPGKRTESRAAVLAYMESHPSAKQSEIAKALGMNVPAIAYHLKQIRKAA